MKIQTALFFNGIDKLKCTLKKKIQDWSILSLTNKYEDLFCQIPQFTEAKAIYYYIILKLV